MRGSRNSSHGCNLKVDLKRPDAVRARARSPRPPNLINRSHSALREATTRDGAINQSGAEKGHSLGGKERLARNKSKGFGRRWEFVIFRLESLKVFYIIILFCFVSH